MSNEATCCSRRASSRSRPWAAAFHSSRPSTIGRRMTCPASPSANTAAENPPHRSPWDRSSRRSRMTRWMDDCLRRAGGQTGALAMPFCNADSRRASPRWALEWKHIPPHRTVARTQRTTPRIHADRLGLEPVHRRRAEPRTTPSFAPSDIRSARSHCGARSSPPDRCIRRQV